VTTDEWLDQMQTVVELLAAGTEFTTDLLWSKVTTDTGEPRMVGALMNRLARSQLIEKTGEYRPTERPEAHSRPVPVWRRLADGTDPVIAAWADYRRKVEARFAAERAEAAALAHLQQLENETREP
jgi:hypothetical protein